MESIPIALPGKGSNALNLASMERTIPLDLVVRRLVRKTYESMQELMRAGAEAKSSAEKRKLLMDWTNNSRAQFLRLYVVVKWAYKSPNLSQYLGVIQALHTYSNVFAEAANNLAFIHGQISGRKAPRYDIATAVDVMTTGKYTRLPAIISERMTNQTALPLTEGETTAMWNDLERIISAKLLSVTIPPAFTSIDISNGRVIVSVKGEYSVSLTMESDQPDHPWRVLSFRSFICAKDQVQNEVMLIGQSHRVCNILQRQMAVTPFNESALQLHEVAHSFCLHLAMSILEHQASQLQRSYSGTSMTRQEDMSLLLAFWDHHREEEDEASKLIVSVQPWEGTNRVVANLSLQCQSSIAECSFPLAFDLTALDLEGVYVEAVRQAAVGRLGALHKALVLNSGTEPLSLCGLRFEFFDGSNTSHTDRAEPHLFLSLYAGRVLFITVDSQTGEFCLVLEGVNSGWERKRTRDLQTKLNANEMSIADLVMELCMNEARAVIAMVFTLLQFTNHGPIRVPEDVILVESKGTAKAGTDVVKPAHTAIFLKCISIPKHYLVLDVIKPFSLACWIVSSLNGLDADNIVHLAVDIPLQQFLDDNNKQFAPGPGRWFCNIHQTTATTHSIQFKHVLSELGSVSIGFEIARHMISKQMHMRNKATLIERKADGHRAPILQLKQFWGDKETLSEEVSILLRPDGWWQVSLHCDDSSTRINDDDFVLQKSAREILRSTNGNHITYHNGKWCLLYKDILDEDFLLAIERDAKVAKRVLAIKEEWDQIVQSVSDGERNVIVETFKAQPLTCARLEFDWLDNRRLELGVRSDGSIKLVFSPTDHVLRRFLETQFQINGSLRELLQLIHRSWVPLQVIEKHLQASSRILPGDFSIIPRSVTQVRVLYRNQYGLDLRFLRDDAVRVDDASITMFGGLHLNSVSSHLWQLTDFSIFMMENIGSLSPDVPAEPKTPHSITVTPHRDAAPSPASPPRSLGGSSAAIATASSSGSGTSGPPFWIGHNVLDQAMVALHRYVGTFLLFRHSCAVVKDLRMERKQKKDPNCATKQQQVWFSIPTLRSNRLAFFSSRNESLQFCCPVQSAAIHGSSDYIALPSTSTFTLSDEEGKILSEFCVNFVTCAPYCPEYISAFVALLQLHTGRLQEMIQLMELQLSLIDAEKRFELMLRVPSSLKSIAQNPVVESGNDVFFVLCLYDGPISKYVPIRYTPMTTVWVWRDQFGPGMPTVASLPLAEKSLPSPDGLVHFLKTKVLSKMDSWMVPGL